VRNPPIQKVQNLVSPFRITSITTSSDPRVRNKANPIRSLWFVLTLLFVRRKKAKVRYIKGENSPNRLGKVIVNISIEPVI
jgi:hypothetical protein